ncbi:MAG: thiamine phosphate synthase [Sandaracinaceae bacterium]|nr:thiamine phosphate synthase [Sandaracinaceae bacterium]
MRSALRSSPRGLYAIVDPAACRDRDPVAVAEAILRGGCAALQLRDKLNCDHDRLGLARRVGACCRAAGVPFVVNDRPDLALLAGADGVHLGQEDLPIAEARRVAGELWIGRSTHDLAQALDAVDQGADLIGFGPVFATSTKERPDPVVGLEGLGEVVRRVAVPVVAIGGVTLERAAEVSATGAPLAAAIAAVCAAGDPERAARALHQALGGADR